MRIGDKVRALHPKVFSIVGNRECVVVATSGPNGTISVEICETGKLVEGYLACRWEVIVSAAPPAVYNFQEGIMIEEPDSATYIPFSEVRTLTRNYINGKINIPNELYPSILALWKENTI